MIYLILLFSLFTSLFANEDSSLSTLANDPSVIIEGKVNAITGEVVDFEQDLTIQGAEPIRLCRAYSCGSLGGGYWSFNRFAYISKVSKHSWVITEPNGSLIKYEKTNTVKIGEAKYLRCVPKNLNDGFSNTTLGKISSRTNYKNNYILLEDAPYRHLIVHAADGTIRTYQTTWIRFDNEQAKYRLLSEQLPNGNWILYDYQEKNNIQMLKSIRSTNPSRDKTFAWADFIYEDSKHPNLKNNNFYVLGSDGQMVRYHFERDDHDRPIGKVYAISSSEAPDSRLEYIRYKNNYSPFLNIDAPEENRLHAISDPCHRRYQIDYYCQTWNTVAGQTFRLVDFYSCKQGRDGRKIETFIPNQHRSKVKTLSAPVNPDGSIYPIYSFIYSDHSTSVYDAEFNRSEYYWSSDDHRLQKIERFSKDGLKLNTEVYVWGSGSDVGNLTCKSRINADGSVLSSIRYIYDARGNVLEERFYGNLSGQGTPILLDASNIPIENGVEVYVKRFSYSSTEPSLLLEEQNDSGCRIVTDYLPKTDLPVSQSTYDRNELKLRKLFEYNSDHILIREVTEMAGLQNSMRTIRQMTPIASEPYIGLPHIIEEKFGEKGSERLLKKTVLTYTTGAKIARQDVYDALNVLQYSIKMAYDAKGRLIERNNPANQIEIFSYDVCGNRTSWRDFSGRLTQTCAYDAFHRPSIIQDKGDDGLFFSRCLGYDLRSNLVSEIDPRGHETKSVYDELNCRIETRLPPIANEKKELISPILCSSFDNAGRETLHTDGLGNSTVNRSAEMRMR